MPLPFPLVIIKAIQCITYKITYIITSLDISFNLCGYSFFTIIYTASLSTNFLYPLNNETNMAYCQLQKVEADMHIKASAE